MEKTLVQPKNILVIRTDRIGDVVLTTPFIRNLRRAYPDARIVVLLSPVTKDLIEGNPDVDEIILDQRKREHKGPIGFFRLVRLIRKQKFDTVFNLHTKKRTNALGFLASIQQRIGYKNNKFGFLLSHPIQDHRHEGKKHESEYCLDILRHFHIPCQTVPCFLPDHQKAQMWVEQFLEQNSLGKREKLFAIHVGASDPSKRWLIEYFAELIDDLIKRYQCKVILIGEVRLRKVSRKVSSLTSAQVYDLTGLTTLAQLVQLLKHCQILISNDSGPVHVASAVETPVVSIFTRNQQGINPERWRPLGKRTKVVSVTKKETYDFKKATEGPSSQAQDLTPTVVLEAVDDVFKLC